MVPTAIHSASMASPSNNSRCVIGTVCAVIGNANVQRNGNAHDRVCAQCGINCIGTNRPDSNSSERKYASYNALTRVVQNVINPSARAQASE